MLLAVEGVTKRFGGMTAVDDVSFEVAERSSVGMLGPNGAGKTTIFDLVAGRHRATEGRILFKGEEITGLRSDRRCRLGIARTFQLIQAFESLSLRDNVVVGALVRDRSSERAAARAEQILERVGLGEVSRLPEELSTIEGKRLELARALATGPDLLLLDEISNGLREDELPPLRALLESIRDDGLTLLVIEHNVKFLAAVCEHVIAVDSGQKLMEGPPAEVLGDSRVVETYLGRRRHDA